MQLTVANHDGIDEQRQYSQLVRGRVFLEQSCRIIVAYGCVCWSLGRNRRGRPQGYDGLLDLHNDDE